MVTGSGTPKSTSSSDGLATDLIGLDLGDGRYAVRSKLGEGSMGVVYLAFDHRLETEVVIKVPTAATLNDPEFAERFQRETRSLVKLKHPHIVTIHDVGLAEGVPYVVMQYLSGGSLRDQLVDASGKLQPQSPETLTKWLPEVARALDFIHKQGFLHRDVKPANILFDEHGHAYLSDFGLAKAVNTASQSSKRDASLTAAGFLVGTPNYVAPELVMGHEHDGRVDQYSLAMTAYEAVAGCVPVEGPTASATMVNQTSMKIPPVSTYVPSFPETVSEVLLRGLSKNQKKRFATCEDLASGIQAALAPPARPKPAVMSGKVARAISAGRIPCPECGKILPLKPQFAGKKARCGQCLHMLLIGQDLATLRVIGPPPAPVEDTDDLAEAPVTNRNKRSAQDTTRNQSGQTSRSRVPNDGDIEGLLGDEAFGFRLSPALAISIALGTIFALMLAAGLIVYFQQHIEIEKKEKELRLKDPRNAEG